ncbi:MAG: hypothetical protein FWD28_03070 [Treponema sp.]|nr:hypothetical protein [Treponema sp.]
MKFRIIIIFLLFLIFFSCNNIKDINLHDDLETINAVINSDCCYFINYSNNPSGVFLKGQNISVLDYYYSVPNEDGIIEIFIKVQAADNGIIGAVNEQYITYNEDSIYNLWNKNIQLIPEYYYYDSIENIYIKDYMPLMYEGVSRLDSIRMMRHFFSENRMLITKKHLIIGNNIYREEYRINSVINVRNNTYQIHLSNFLNNELILTLFIDENNSLTIVDINILNNNHYMRQLFNNSLNIRYIPYEIEKSKVLNENVIRWAWENGK